MKPLFAAFNAALIVAAFCLGASGIWPAQKVSNAYHRLTERSGPKAALNPADNLFFQELAPLHRHMPPAPVSMVGDSITQFGPWNLLLPEPSKVANYGIASDTTRGVLQRLREGLPIGKTVFVMAGSNDLDSGITSAESRANIRDIVSFLRGHRVYLQSVLLSDRGPRNRRANEINSYASSLCSRQKVCTFLDLNKELSDGATIKKEMTVDGVHLTWPAYVLWARLIRPLSLDAEQGNRLTASSKAPSISIEPLGD